MTLPFVVRSVQPVLMEVDREAEQAAASLGAGGWTIFRQIILPALYPALLGGAGLAFARAVGEFGSVVLIGGGIPRETEVASQYIAKQIEIDRPASAAAVSVALLLISFAVLFAIRCSPRRGRSDEVRSCATAALAYLGALVLVPLGMILYRTFEDGFVAFWESVTTPAAISAISPLADRSSRSSCRSTWSSGSSRRWRWRAGTSPARACCRRSSTCRSRSRR